MWIARASPAYMGAPVVRRVVHSPVPVWRGGRGTGVRGQWTGALPPHVRTGGDVSTLSINTSVCKSTSSNIRK